jgi:hypothetical protein
VAVDETSRLFFCSFVTSKGELIEKVLPLAMAWVTFGRDDMYKYLNNSDES